MRNEQDIGISADVRLGRRAVLRGSLLGGAGLAAAALIGCGGDEEPTDEQPTSAAAEAGTGTGPGELIQDPDLPYPWNFPDRTDTKKPGGIMTVAATWDVQNVDPTISASGGTVTVPNMVYNRLIGFKRGPEADVNKPELEGELASSWERSPDGMTFTFQMTPGIKWQNLPPLNGRPFVAADAAFAMNRYMTEGVHQSYYVNVDTIEAVDDATLKVTMKRPVADFLYPIGSNKQTIFPKELVDSGEITSRVVGTGPMIMKEMTPSSKVTFEKNPDYWETDVLLDGFEFRIMPEHASKLAAFRAGQVDYAYSLVSTLSDLNSILDTNPDVQVNMIPASTTAFAMNLANPKFEDIRVRRALALAINRDEVTQIVYEGLAKVENTIPWTYIFDEAPTVESGLLGDWAHHDPEEAKRLLDAAGVPDLTMNNMFFAYTEGDNRAMEVLVVHFRDVGVTMTGGRADYTEFNSQWIGRKLPEVSTRGWPTTGFDADNWFYGQVHSTSPGNRWNINDPDIDRWAEEQQVELDPEARKEIWRKMWDLELDQAYRPLMSSPLRFEVYQPWVRGIRWTGGPPGDNSSYYNWGDQVGYGWLDK